MRFVIFVVNLIAGVPGEGTGFGPFALSFLAALYLGGLAIAAWSLATDPRAVELLWRWLP
jgi:hypothetical protein